MDKKHATLSEEMVSPPGGAVAGGVAGGIAGAALAGPLGILPGAALGAVGGLMAGKRAQEELRPQVLYPDGDLEHFQQVFQRMPYYTMGMDWSDYEPAYRFAIQEYAKIDEYQGVDQLQPKLEQAWLEQKGQSRLPWLRVRPVIEHIWNAYDTGIDSMGMIQPPIDL